MDVNVAAQEEDESSVLNFYRKAIALRKSLSCVKNGSYQEYGKLSADVYTYAREDEKQKLLVVCSYTERAVDFAAPKGFDLADASLILQNYAAPDAARLQPYETRVYLWEK